jgi:hypothetical protein
MANTTAAQIHSRSGIFSTAHLNRLERRGPDGIRNRARPPCESSENYPRNRPGTGFRLLRTTRKAKADGDGEGFDATDAKHCDVTQLCKSNSQSAAQSGAISPNSDPIDVDLRALINRWPTLQPAVKAEILAIIRRSG